MSTSFDGSTVIQQPRVAVGIPVYNGGDQLALTLESVLLQRFSDLEVIICDNCSTDQTAEVSRSFALRDKRVRYYRNESNLGASKNFARVLELAGAPLFLWAAHDDVRDSDYLSALVDVLEKEPSAALATGRCRFVDAGGLERPDWGIAPFASGNSLAVTNTLFKSHSTHWIYGLFRRHWLCDHVWQFSSVDPWGGDFLFLLGMALDGLIAGSADAVLVKQIKYESPMRPQTPRQIARWNARYLRALVKTIGARPNTWARKIDLYRAAAIHFRTHIASYDAQTSFTILARAFYHFVTKSDRP